MCKGSDELSAHLENPRLPDPASSTHTAYFQSHLCICKHPAFLRPHRPKTNSKCRLVCAVCLEIHLLVGLKANELNLSAGGRLVGVVDWLKLGLLLHSTKNHHVIRVRGLELFRSHMTENRSIPFNASIYWWFQS